MPESENWKSRVSLFTEGVGLEYDDVTARLVKIVGDPNDEGVALLSNRHDAPDDLLREQFPGVPAAKLNRAIRKLRSGESTVEATSVPAAVLPQPPDDESFLAALKIGGIAKVSGTDVNAALRALLARDLGLYSLPEQLLHAMESHAESLDEPVDETFYELQKLVTERRYGDILSSLGVHGRLVSESRKKRLFERMNSIWGSLHGFQARLDGWIKSWTDRMNNPAAIMTSMAAVLGAGSGPPAHMMEHPDTGPVRDAAEGVVNQLNKTFAGTGIPVARALAYDALRVKKILEDERLPAAVGASSREEMLKKLKVGVTADYVRSERDLATYVLSILDLANVPAASEPGYLVALHQLGSNIPWEKLGVGTKGQHQTF